MTPAFGVYRVTSSIFSYPFTTLLLIADTHDPFESCHNSKVSPRFLFLTCRCWCTIAYVLLLLRLPLLRCLLVYKLSTYRVTVLLVCGFLLFLSINTCTIYIDRTPVMLVGTCGWLRDSPSEATNKKPNLK